MSFYSLTEVTRRIRLDGLEVKEDEIETFVLRAWVRPEAEQRPDSFDEADIARIRLIIELQRDMSVNNEAMPVVLDLLDQLYGLRAQVDEMNALLKQLPEDLRSSIRAHLEDQR